MTAEVVPIVIRCPMAAGSPLKRDCQKDQLTTATGSAPASIVGRNDHSSHRGLHAERFEETADHILTVDRRGLEPLAADLKAEGRHRDQIGEHMVVVTEVFVDPPAESIEARLTWKTAQQLDQPLRLLHGQRPQHERVDQAEDRGVGADPQRERHHGDDGEEGIAAHLPRREAAVADEVFEPREAPLIAHGLHGLRQPAGFNPRQPRGLGRRVTLPESSLRSAIRGAAAAPRRGPDPNAGPRAKLAVTTRG